MPVWGWIVLAVVVAAVFFGAAWLAYQRNRSRELREQFGPEYYKTVAESDSKRDAESQLMARRERREQLDIRPLPEPARRRYTDGWREIQALFVDDPGRAFQEADRLVVAVMRERGYPMDDFEQRVADVSVDHPDVVEHYRDAERIARANERGGTQTEDLRQGMVHYRALFQELLRPEAANSGVR
jgi:hypothetical protein